MFLGEIFQDRAPDHLRGLLDVELRKGEMVVGLRKTSTEDAATEAPLWLLVTTQRNALISASEAGKSAFREVPIKSPVAVDKGLTHVTWSVADQTFASLRVASGGLEDLVEIAFESRPRMLYLAAQAHAEDGDWESADGLYAACAESLEGSDAFSAEGHLEPREDVLLRRSVAAAHLGRHDATVTFLARLSELRPDDDLVEVGERVDPPSDWWLTLALAHEEAGDHASAAAVYEKLHGQEKDDLFLLSRARNLRDIGEVDEALAAYDTFVAGRSEEDFRLVAAQAEQAAELDQTSDIGTKTALLESAAMLEKAGRLEDAFDRYVDAVRFAPYSEDPFRGLFALVERLPSDALEERRFVLRQSAEVVRIILPRLAEQLTEDGALPADEDHARWAEPFATLDDETHDEIVVHSGERATGTMAQKWTAALLKDERDTDDIVRHAQRADDGSHPIIETVLDNVSELLGIPRPRVFLSHGSTGVGVLGTREPFLLVGAAHLDANGPLALSDSELAFALASQMEHIRAGHLLLTSSEFWKTFGTLSMTAVLAFVPMGDLVGKFADGAVLKWFGKLKSAPSDAVTKMIEIAEKRVQEGASREKVQSAYTATLGKLRQVGLASAETDDTHMVKERLADFARCAQYTADRVGLLVTDDLSDSVAAILRLSPAFGPEADAALDEGLAAVLAERGAKGRLVHGELALRLGELIKFAMSDEYRGLREVAAP